MINFIAPLVAISALAMVIAHIAAALYAPAVRQEISSAGFPAFFIMFAVDTAIVTAVLFAITSLVSL